MRLSDVDIVQQHNTIWTIRLQLDEKIWKRFGHTCYAMVRVRTLGVISNHGVSDNRQHMLTGEYVL